MSRSKSPVGRAFLVLLGPSGVGKSTQMEALPALDSRFVKIRAFTTRPPRPGETEKRTVSEHEFASMAADGAFAVVNCVYGHRYGTPRHDVEAALAAGLFPVMDFPWERVPILRNAFPGAVFAVYLVPPSLAELRGRLAGREDADRRLALAAEELARLEKKPVRPPIDARVVVEGTQREVAVLLRDVLLEQH